MTKLRPGKLYMICREREKSLHEFTLALWKTNGEPADRRLHTGCLVLALGKKPILGYNNTYEHVLVGDQIFVMNQESHSHLEEVSSKP